jgi:hypothetical protein
MSRPLRRLCTWILEYALVAFALLAAIDASAQVTGCIADENGSPLRRVWVEHLFTSQLTNSSGCVTIAGASGVVEVRVHAHNPVIRAENEWQWPISQVVRFTNGQTVRIGAEGEWFQLAEHFRRAYNDGLREFEPWANAEFPGGSTRINSEFLRVVTPELLPVVASYTEPRPTTPTTLQNPIWFYPLAPLVHVLESQRNLETAAHELGHALHFAQLSPVKRMQSELVYLEWIRADLMSGGSATHCFERRTIPMVAYLEAFGFFAETYPETAPVTGSGPARHAAFFEDAEEQGIFLRVPDPACSNGEPGPVLGADVEGAVFMALFVDFAKRVGLDLVVETYATCEALDVFEYGECVRARYGASSFEYRALREATWRYGIWLEQLPSVAGGSETGDAFGRALARGDFDGDGYADLAVGVPNEDIGTVADAGMVNVLHGGPFGIGPVRNQAWHHDVAGVPGVAAAGDRLGAALAAGDIDRDGFDDLAIGAPGAAVSGNAAAGHVLVLYGSPAGLTVNGAQVRHEDSAGVAGVAAVRDTFATSLALGDLDGDGFGDLAVGIPGQDLGSVVDAGAALLLFGSPWGLDSLRSVVLQQPTGRAIAGDLLPEPSDRFGSSLAVCNFDGDAYGDLAVGVPNEDVGTLRDAGAVHVFYGASSGLVRANQLWHQNSLDIEGVSEAYDLFGTSLACGDFDADEIADLAIGVPAEDVGTLADAGAVNVIYGAPGSLTAAGNQIWDQNSPNIEGASEAGDAFGAILAAGDLIGDGADDLAIGAPGEDLAVADAGAVAVLRGSWLEEGLSRFADVFLSEPTSAQVAGDAYGSSLAIGDFDGERVLEIDADSDGVFDASPLELAVGVPRDDRGTATDAGSVRLHSSVLFTANAAQDLWHQSR